MPKEYIVRLVFDRNHRTLCVARKTEKGISMVGGICFRPFYEQNLAEIVFCAITSKEQVKGFTKCVSLSNSDWAGFIKEYDGGTLMECKLHPKVNYLYMAEILALQKEHAQGEIRKISFSHVIYPGLKHFHRKRHTNKTEEPKQAKTYEELCNRYKRIPGLVKAGWTPNKNMMEGEEHCSKEMAELHAKIGSILKEIKSSKDSWPFQTAVDAKQVPDYYNIIKKPMDLTEITRKLNERRYMNKKDFQEDVELIISNCKKYNNKETSYYRCAEVIEKLLKKLIE